MIKRFALLCVSAFLPIWGIAQIQKTILSAQVYDYQRDMVYFDCVQTPLIHQEFHVNPGEIHSYPFDTEQIVAMFINGRTKILLLPGDSLHAVIRYEGKNVTSIDFTGTEQAVFHNRLYRDIERLKRDMRYKTQLLGCVVLDVKPKDRINDSRLLLDKVKNMIEEVGSACAPSVANYIMAEIESLVYNSFMEYPVMYAETRKLPVEKQEIGDYWNLMDGYVLRKDAASLRVPEYAGLLMRYCFYRNEYQARERGEDYKIPDVFEGMYKELASFYEGELRDFVLYTLLVNFIRNGKEIERADVLVKDYKERYNINKEHMHILDNLLQ